MNHSESPQIQALKQRYKASLVDKIELVLQQIEAIETSAGASDSIAEAHDVLHKLAGSSGMYGYDDINILCRDVMAELDALTVDGSIAALKQVVELLEQHC